MATEFTRMIQKRTFLPEGSPSIPPVDDINQFSPTDIFVGELYFNATTGKLWTRAAEELVEINPTKTMVIEIGEWNMSAGTKIVSIPGPEIDASKVVSITVQVVNDDGDTWFVNGPDLWVQFFDAGNVTLRRGPELSDNTRTDINRGLVKIELLR